MYKTFNLRERDLLKITDFETNKAHCFAVVDFRHDHEGNQFVELVPLPLKGGAIVEVIKRDETTLIKGNKGKNK